MSAVPGSGPGLRQLRNWLYERGLRATRRLPVPVVSVGNLATGGTGKTPFTELLARLLSDEGYLACILSRGYGGVRDRDPMIVSDLRRIRQGPAQAGDEPFLLARRLPGVAVVVGRDRYRAGLHALEELELHAFVLDDGFQHRRLARDVDLVLLDAQDPWAGGRLVPWGGPSHGLRESAASLRRAHGVVLTGAQRVSPERLSQLQAEVGRLAPNVPILVARSRLSGVRRLPDSRVEPVATLDGRRVVAACAVARPERFFDDLTGAGAELLAKRPRRDHHPFTTDEVRSLARTAQRVGASAIVTTEKDAVRLPLPRALDVPVLAVRMRLTLDAPAALVRILADNLPSPTRGGKPL